MKKSESIRRLIETNVQTLAVATKIMECSAVKEQCSEEDKQSILAQWKRVIADLTQIIDELGPEYDEMKISIVS